MTSIPFQQRHASAPRTSVVYIEVTSDLTGKQADDLFAAGATFHLEMLSDYEALLRCVSAVDRREVLAFEVTRAGVGLIPAVERLVATAHEAL